jgi:hypothetical protein
MTDSYILKYENLDFLVTCRETFVNVLKSDTLSQKTQLRRIDILLACNLFPSIDELRHWLHEFLISKKTIYDIMTSFYCLPKTDTIFSVIINELKIDLDKYDAFYIEMILLYSGEFSNVDAHITHYEGLTDAGKELYSLNPIYHYDPIYTICKEDIKCSTEDSKSFTFKSNEFVKSL